MTEYIRPAGTSYEIPDSPLCGSDCYHGVPHTVRSCGTPQGPGRCVIALGSGRLPFPYAGGTVTSVGVNDAALYLGLSLGEYPLSWPLYQAAYARLLEAIRSAEVTP